MRPEDPNFPQEIPPIPPPRQGGEAEPEDLPRLPGDAESVVGSTDVAETDEPSMFTTASGSEYPSSGDESPESVVVYRFSAADPEISPKAASASPSQNASPAPAEAPWTDSDLQNIEDPLSVPPAEPSPTYIDRGRQPNSATVADASTGPVVPAEDVWADTGIPYQPKELGVVDQLLLLLADGVTLWKKALRWVRSQLPPDLQRQLSDGVLTAIALGLLMLCLALWNPLGKEPGVQVASEPGAGTGAEAPLPPAEAYFPDAPGEEAPVVAPDSTSAPEIAPAAEPTPAQTLIADIQTQVSRISRSYGAGLIQSVEVNLPENTLDVNVAEVWYGLLATQQNEIAQDIFAQAQGLNFGTLELRDPEGVVVARNPVVGPNMVVLHRLRSLDADWRVESRR